METFYERFCKYREHIWRRKDGLEYLRKDKEEFLEILKDHEWTKENFDKMMHSEDYDPYSLQSEMAWQICELQREMATREDQ